MYPCASSRQAPGVDRLLQTPLLFLCLVHGTAGKRLQPPSKRPEVKKEKRSAQLGNCAPHGSLSKAYWKLLRLSASTKRANLASAAPWSLGFPPTPPSAKSIQ